jgi:acetyl esterase/lipase
MIRRSPLFAVASLPFVLAACSSDASSNGAGDLAPDAGTPSGDASSSDAGTPPPFPTTDLTADSACSTAGCLRSVARLPAAEAAAATLSAFAPAGTTFENGFKAYLVKYVSAKSDEVSATLFIPDTDAPASGYPAILLSQPTTGIAPKCAPSEGLLATAIAAHVASHGFAVMLPDATSFGAPPYAPYLHKETAATATLDGARVLLRLGTAVGARIRREVVLAGHSQGAHSTLSAAEYWLRYAPELPVRGVAVNGPPSHFLEGATYSLTNAGAFGYFLAMRMWSWRRALDPSQPEVLVGTAAQNAENTFLECQNEGANPGSGTLPDLVPLNAQGVVNPVYIQMAQRGVNGWAEPWKTWHVENVPHPKALPVPVAVWQGLDDATVLPSDTRAYVAELRAGGLQVELKEVAGAQHNDCVMGPVTLPQADQAAFLAWVRARFVN